MKSRKFSVVTTLTTFALVFALLAPERSYCAQTTTQPAPASAGQPQPEFIGPWCIPIAIVIGIGAGGIYIMIKLCKKLQPPAPPATPPPPPPTNAPPVLTNPPVNVSRLVKLLDSGPPTPGGTNPPPGGTNVFKPHVPYYWLPVSWASNSVAITNVAAETDSWMDVSSYNWTDSNGTNGASQYYAYITGALTNLATSTDLVNWSNYTFQAWVSTNGTMTILSDGTGLPVYTNYAAAGSTGATNTVPLTIYVGDEQKKFYRMTLTQ